jgi:acyl-CoA synthetase (AMP-forming)/AMP-acid ligase II
VIAKQRPSLSKTERFVARTGRTASFIAPGADSIQTAFAGLHARSPHRPLFTFLDERGREQEILTVARLADDATAIAAALRARGLRPGDRAVLAYLPSLDFIRALLGCMAAGVVAVPVDPPHPSGHDSEVDAFAVIAAGCGAKAVLTDTLYDRSRKLTSLTSLFGRGGSRWPEVPWYRTDRWRLVTAAPFDWYVPDSLDEVALLRYVSGADGVSRGIMLSYGNLHHEMTAQAHDLDLGPRARLVLWSPPHQDLTLVGGILNVLSGNGHLYLMSPRAFLRRPALWPEVMARVRATHTAAPSSGFDLAVRKTAPEQRRRWDLSALRLVMSVEAPIRPSTVRAFIQAFAQSGLAPHAFCPAYGRSELTGMIALGGTVIRSFDQRALEQGRIELAVPGSGRPTATFVSCGRVTKAHASVRIVDPRTRRPSPADGVGEIWVDSFTKGLGYYGLDQETRQVFRARIASGAGGEDPREYLRTGDRGFFWEDELFVVGRVEPRASPPGEPRRSPSLQETWREGHTNGPMGIV